MEGNTIPNNLPPVQPSVPGTGHEIHAAGVKKEAAQVSVNVDVVVLGKGKAISNDQAMQIVYERSLEKLKSVVSEARQQLGLGKDEALDTSPEATAKRIADFAVNAYDVWRAIHKDLSEEDARKQFATFIGGAVKEGIADARKILGALSALSPEIDKNIDTIDQLVSRRLEDFAGGA